MRKYCATLTLLLPMLLLGACSDEIDIEDHRRGSAETFMVAAAHPLATQAGYDILAAGGSAVDAAIAVQMVLTLVEPQASGIGGGAFLVHHDASSHKVMTYDGRETAPAGARADLFVNPDGTPMSWREAALGGKAVGVPGVMRMFELAHADHGVLPWEELFDAAILHARDGFKVTPRLAMLLERDTEMREIPGTAEYFYPDGDALQVGDVLRNPDYAETLEVLARDGAAAFYAGDIAADIADAVRQAPVNPANMTVADLAGYQAKRRDPVCARYREHRVCGMGPPSSGGLLVGQILGKLAHFDLPGMKPNSPQAQHLIIEASRLAFADRGLYVGDADFVPVPVQGLLDENYLKSRAREMSPTLRMETATPGRAGRVAWHFGPDTDGPKGLSTTHYSIHDKYGNTVSITSTIERAFGSKLMVRGFLLNNELTDFSFRPTDQGRPIANAVAPGKRPRSTMSPSLIFDNQGRLVMAIGSPGGSRIAGYTLRTIINALDWNMHIADAIATPHVISRGGIVDIEEHDGAAAIAESLNSLGHETRIRALTSGLHGIHFHADGTMTGGADPRREGVVLGD